MGIPTPVSLDFSFDFNSVGKSSGAAHSCGILDDGSIKCWGYNLNGRLGDGTTADSNKPVAVNLPVGRTASELALGASHSCAILDDGSMMCWGDNNYGRLGDGTTADSNTPVQ